MEDGKSSVVKKSRHKTTPTFSAKSQNHFKIKVRIVDTNHLPRSALGPSCTFIYKATLPSPPHQQPSWIEAQCLNNCFPNFSSSCE